MPERSRSKPATPRTRGTGTETGGVAASVPSDGPLGPLGPGPYIDLDALVPVLERRWGADREGGRFRCPIPGHEDHALIGPALDLPAAPLMLQCCKGRSRSLGEVRAAIGYGHDVRLSNIEIAVWLRRLAYECDQFEPVVVEVPAVAPSTTAWVAEAAEGFRLDRKSVV